MAQQAKTVGQRILSEVATWTIAALLSTVIGLALLSLYWLVAQRHHDADITRLDNRIDLECVKRLP